MSDSNTRNARGIYLPLAITIIYIMLLGWGSLASASDVRKLGFSFHDKGLHFVAYLVLALIVYYLFSALSVRISPVVASLLFASIIGIALEYCQITFTRDRIFGYTDVAANIAGAAVGLLFFRPVIVFIAAALGKPNSSQS